jgi:hypothetical protein
MVEDMSLAEFAASGRLFLVESALLGGRFWFAADERAARRAPPGEPVYTAAEMQVMDKADDPILAIALHAIKRKFLGARIERLEGIAR